MLSLPWSVVTALRLEPVGPIAPAVFGLRWNDDVEDRLWGDMHDEAYYVITDPHKVRQMRDALGGLVDSPTGLRHPSKTPFYTALCELQRGVSE